ncbi:NAD(P)-dependent dehydrogenase (short-subunit alcohol dehydrogenase family) [Pontibacter ummariensis]|uniref:NAD(P)-dependent dehydrogenase, short-chain alcohol dehydrogenase family n=1 Tax=Pontibacter ummariensis TaxID=1610492 RepID=A0A239CMY6_9BACT|nr:SDR family oxidoreductase [Pontibacter ummariensis]PRY14959.1 NAD(P)-dependent dehydrogenase (short-subunit alcohol dehydrogenase family) [Pontibacter ummariensis]SNS20703.1 NAD(P)-dependent dehydrogenase, short-chain alcohol dehydrogenase family [Pontibacter ummariensis]
MENKPKSFPPQHFEQPAREGEMTPEPEIIRDSYKGADKLKDKVALITGGDSGIGRAVAVHFAREGADVAIVYLEEDKDAQKTKELVEKEGRKCLVIAGDVGDEAFAQKAVQQTVDQFGKLDVLVNNAGEQHVQKDIRDISAEQLQRTFSTNIFGMFYFVKAALDHLKEGSTIVNTTSVTAYHGNKVLVDYSATKGAILAFTRSLAKMLAEKKIRVNGVAPGPIWTPLIPGTFPEEKVKSFGSNTPLKRAGQPSEVAPAYVYLASEDSAYTVGEIVHVNGGEMVAT